jgi:hypothetical protein
MATVAINELSENCLGRGITTISAVCIPFLPCYVVLCCGALWRRFVVDGSKNRDEDPDLDEMRNEVSKWFCRGHAPDRL